LNIFVKKDMRVNVIVIDEDEIHIKINSERSGSEFICKFSEINNGTPSLMF
jgi:hypothetical protein